MTGHCPRHASATDRNVIFACQRLFQRRLAALRRSMASRSGLSDSAWVVALGGQAFCMHLCGQAVRLDS